MLHAHAADFVPVLDDVLARELAHLLDETGRLDVFVGSEVVGDERDLLRVEHLVETGFLELVDGHARGHVVAERQVEFRHHEVARCDRILAGRPGQYLLGHGHSHATYPRSM
jgi:hypothetical protein